MREVISKELEQVRIFVKWHHFREIRPDTDYNYQFSDDRNTLIFICIWNMENKNDKSCKNKINKNKI